MFKKFAEKRKIKQQIKQQGVYLDIHTTKLKQDVEFVLYHLPKSMIHGIEIVEELFDVEPEPHQIIVKPTMTAMDIKRQIGHFVFRRNRWSEQEVYAKKLLAEEKIDLKMFYDIYDTDDYLAVYEIINADLFAVAYGNPSMKLDEIAHAINSLYVRKLYEKTHATSHSLSRFVDELFENNEQPEK